MTRTKGSKDKKPRKQRKDKNKKRKKYRGKPVKKKRRKKGRMTPYIPIRHRDSPIKLWAWEQVPMSKQGYQNFSRKVRPYMRKITYHPTLRIDVSSHTISNKESVEKLFLEHLWEGTWLIMGFSHGKNKLRVKPVKLCKIKISNHPEGLKAKMINNYRLFRYWFWIG